MVGRMTQTMLGVFSYHVDLPDLFIVMQLEGREISPGETPLFRLQEDGHGRPEDRQSLVEPDDLLIVQP